MIIGGEMTGVQDFTCRFAAPLCSRECIPLDLRLSFHAGRPATARARGCQRKLQESQELLESEKY